MGRLGGAGWGGVGVGVHRLHEEDSEISSETFSSPVTAQHRTAAEKRSNE